MLYKLFGNVILISFVLSLLVFTNYASSHENRRDWYEITTNYKCPTGEIVDSKVEWVLNKWFDNHPEGFFRWEWFCWEEYDPDIEDWVVKCKLERVYHVDHPITDRVYEDYQTITRRGTPNRCRRYR